MNQLVKALKSIGPAIIVAAVVCGPGSILTSSKIGALYGYSAIWILLIACLLMWSMILLSSKLGVALKHTPCTELANRLGRPVAVIVGIILFLVVAAFQSSNNLAILAAIEPFLNKDPHEKALSPVISIMTLLILNGFIVLAVYKFKDLYNPIEKLMKILVLCVVASFIINFLVAQPSLISIIEGCIPNFNLKVNSWLPYQNGDKVTDDLVVIQALIATTFSVAGAFYQAYMVREKGYDLEQFKKNRIDSFVGVGILGFISLIIMSTAAASFYSKVPTVELNSVSDVARQLEPLFGPMAKYFFSIGIFAGGFGAFFVNAMIGGHLLSDGLGLGHKISDKWTRHLTALALLIGMSVAIFSTATGKSPVGLIIFAQALTVLGLPALSLTLIYLATRPELTGPKKIPTWNITLAGIGFLLTLFLAIRTGVRLWLSLS